LSESFVPTKLPCTLDVTHIVTLHDFRYTRDFLFTGESHDFWEMVFIRRGAVGVMAGNSGYTLGSNEAVFHAPNEYHNIWANGDSAEVVVLTFMCESPAMKFFERKMMSLSESEIRLIEEILALGSVAFSEPPDIIYQKKLLPRESLPAGTLQLLKLKLEELLIRLIQSSDTISRTERRSEDVPLQNDKLITDAIIRTLTSRVFGSITLDEVCSGISYSKSYLKNVFKRNTGFSIMDYYANLKIERAKILIKDGKMSVSEIAEKLGFSSINYFSRAFKKKTGLSPTEYRLAKTL